ncbi:MAG TPA: ribokinase [Acidobacteriaceae bacterium]|nr:ribokinase [Acidobacteriaceae bacterium]
MNAVTIVGSYIAALVMDVASIPLEGETVIGRDFHTTHGGKGSNMAACAARLGASARFFGKVGRDAFGKGFVQLLDQEKVDGSALLFSDTKPTAVGFIIFSSKGSNVIVIDMAANGEFSPADITAHSEVITSSAVAVSPLEIPVATALAAASVARAAGTKFILNPAPAVDLRDADLSAVFALTPNELEGRVCLGLRPDDPMPDNEVVLELLRLGVDNVMLTRGGKGVLWGSSAGLVEVPAPPVVVVDTVGAGDAFNAGLAVGLSEKRTTLEAIALGVTAASLSTQRRETIASYAYRPEVDLCYEKTLRAAF